MGKLIDFRNVRCKMSLLVLSGLLALSSGMPAMGQVVQGSTQQIIKREVTGRVVDDNGEPIIGATIREKGSNGGTTSDVDGNFILKMGQGTQLEVSYIGFTSQTVDLQGRNTVQVVLRQSSIDLSEVVVVGYGTMRKGDITSAVSSVKAKDFTKGNIGDAAELVKGKVAGLTIAKGTGDPNATSTVRLRGIISLQGSSTPLVLVDGIAGDLESVAPENIASIDVLKDASAAAIYGTRGASGVILITTKTGKRETRTTAQYSSYMSISNWGKTLDFMDAQDVRDGNTSFVDRGYDTDWLDAISRTSFSHNHHFNISGGSSSTTYSADFAYRNNQGVIVDTYGEDMRMAFDVSHWMLNDMLKVNLNIAKNRNKVDAISASGLGSFTYRQALMRNPSEPIYNEDGTYFENFGILNYFNPVAMIQEKKGYNVTENTRMTGNVTFEPIKGWQTNLMLSRVSQMSHNRGYESSEYYGQKIDSYTGCAYHMQTEYITDMLEITSKYSGQVGKHRLEALAGYSYQYNNNEGFNAYNLNFPTDFYEWNNLGLGTQLKKGSAGMGSYRNDNKLIGFFGRVSYGYDDRYNVLVSVRREGSSKFGDNHKWATFPSISLGWNITREKFMQNVSWLDNLRLRAGYGVTGVIVGGSYNSLTKYAYGSPYYYDNGIWKQGLQVISNPNPDLKWETSREFNIGLDWAVLGERISGSIDIYQKKTSDMLWNYTVPTPPNLYNTTLANVGKMRNQGIEVALNAIPVRTSDFEWKTTVTLSHNANKLLSLSNDLYETTNYYDPPEANLGEPFTQRSQRIEEGRSMGQFFGLKSVGVSENGLWLIENPKTGEIEEITDATLSDDSYYQWLGNAMPDVYLGWSNTLKYKNFDLSMQFTGQFGFKIMNNARVYFENNSVAYNRLRSVKDAPYGGEYTLSSTQKQQFVSYHLENGDFLKLSTLTLGYNVPLKKNKYVSAMRAYVSGENIFCITGYSGLDPELSNDNIMNMGIDWKDRYPTARTFTMGINITF